MMEAVRNGAWSKIGGVMPTAKDYVQDGLGLLIDGNENGGLGTHVQSLSSWKNLSNVGQFSDVRLSGEYIVGDNYIQFNDSAINSSTGTGIGRCDVLFPIQEKTIEVCFSGLKLNWISDSNRKNAVFTYPSTFGSLWISMGNWNNLGILTFGLWTSLGVDSVFYGPGSDIQTPIDKLTSFSFNTVNSSFVRDSNEYSSPISTSTESFQGTLELFNRSTDFARPFNGKMHCMRIYNRALSAAEMIANQDIDYLRFGPAKTT